jgi:K+-transporting ATPase KdpF subunit
MRVVAALTERTRTRHGFAGRLAVDLSQIAYRNGAIIVPIITTRNKGAALNDGRYCYGPRVRLFLRSRSATPTSANSFEGEWVMIFDYSLAALVAAGLLCYLFHALLRPERF